MKLKELSVLHRENPLSFIVVETLVTNGQKELLLLEGLVDWPEPADVGAWSEEDEPQDGHAKVGRSSTAAHPGKTTNQIKSQSGAVHCQHHRQAEG